MALRAANMPDSYMNESDEDLQDRIKKVVDEIQQQGILYLRTDLNDQADAVGPANETPEGEYALVDCRQLWIGMPCRLLIPYRDEHFMHDLISEPLVQVIRSLRKCRRRTFALTKHARSF